ncbi:MAG: peptidoglycan-binding protein [Phormidesmis sp. RL_2_1]|nr:peptidoglycan-binding protein [Phormidesmis sp. RL_2_1]
MPFTHLPDELPLEPLYEGDHGAAVAQLQLQLNSLSLYQGEINGQFDLTTKQALQAFQDQHELTDEAGFLGLQTWYALTFWSQETAWPLPAISFSVRRSIEKLLEAAAHQPEPLFANILQPRFEIEPGQLLFWPPLPRKMPRKMPRRMPRKSARKSAS